MPSCEISWIIIDNIKLANFFIDWVILKYLKLGHDDLCECSCCFYVVLFALFTIKSCIFIEVYYRSKYRDDDNNPHHDELPWQSPYEEKTECQCSNYSRYVWHYSEERQGQFVDTFLQDAEYFTGTEGFNFSLIKCDEFSQILPICVGIPCELLLDPVVVPKDKAYYLKYHHDNACPNEEINKSCHVSCLDIMNDFL